MHKEDTRLQKLRNELDDKISELKETQSIYAQEKETLQDRIALLETALAMGRASNAETIRKLT